MARNKETTIQRAERLKASGEWDDFVKTKQRFRDEGMSPAKSDIEAWKLFPPPADSEKRQQREEALAEKQWDGKTQPLPDDLEWVRKNLMNGRIEDAPTECAAAILDMAKNDFNEYVRTFVKTSMPSAKALEAAAKFTDDGRNVKALIDRVYKAAIEAVDEVVEEAKAKARQ